MSQHQVLEAAYCRVWSLAQPASEFAICNHLISRPDRAGRRKDMWGIAGLIDLAGRRETDRLKVRPMAPAPFRRGSDDCGFLFAPGVGLSHRRLSIVGIVVG